MMIAKRSVFLALIAAGMLIPGGSAWAQRGGMVGRGGDLLSNPEVQKDLELLDDQIQAIETANAKIREKMQGIFESLRNVPREQWQEKFAGVRTELQTMREKELSAILLPTQMKRLKQLEFQSQVTRGGSGRAFENQDLMKQLGLSDEQMEQIRKVAAEAQAEMSEKLKELRKQAQDKILSVLTPQQRREFDELFGDPFEFATPQPPGGQRGQQRAAQPPASTGNRVETQ